MMMMTMTLVRSESESDLRRRARVIAWRLAHGEMIIADLTDPVWEYVRDGYRVAHGAAAGSVP
jgi:hypothetical protein